MSLVNKADKREGTPIFAPLSSSYQVVKRKSVLDEIQKEKGFVA